MSSSFPSIPMLLVYTHLYISLHHHSNPILLCPSLPISLQLQLSWPSPPLPIHIPSTSTSTLIPSHTLTPLSKPFFSSSPSLLITFIPTNDLVPPTEVDCKPLLRVPLIELFS